jgi:hypothetical protein
MLTLKVRNVHEALPEGMRLVNLFGVTEESRNGPVRVLPDPLSTCYLKPQERVELWPQRDSNPFFHLFEALWMLAGRNDVAFPARFAKQIGQYSDNGRTFNGAYGYRWRNHFGRDQLTEIVEALQKNPTCRRQVLSMWDARNDLGLDSKDVPCNLNACFQIAQGKLNLVVYNRSNDLVWGAYGANAVHFSVLQEYMAARIGVEVGTYHQVSMNSHIYLAQHARLMLELAAQVTDPPGRRNNPYTEGGLTCQPLVSDLARFDAELPWVLEGLSTSKTIKEPFFRDTVVPMTRAFNAYQKEALVEAVELAKSITAPDWRRACVDWLTRRAIKRGLLVSDGLAV